MEVLRGDEESVEGRISNLEKLVIWVFINGDFGYGLLWVFDDFVGFEKMGLLGFMNLYLS